MTDSLLFSQPNLLQGAEGLHNASGAFFEVSEEAVRGLTSSGSFSDSTNNSSSSCSGFPKDQPSETTSTTTVTTSTDSVTNSTATVSNDTKKQLQKQERESALKCVLLQQLEKQLAFYFSPSNLETDTYMRTLQELNDGCVPVRALANFGKVKGILWATPTLTRQHLEEESRMEMIVESIQRAESSILQVEDIDISTGKILLQVDEWQARNTIKGVRLNPGTTFTIEEGSIAESLAEPFSNTILLRDVHPDVTEEQVYHLLLNEVAKCPPVVSLRRDVGNYWFIVLDCDSKESMLNVVIQLRSLTLLGEYIHARLKSSTLHQAPFLDPVAVVIAEQVARRRKKRRGLRQNKKKLSVTENDRPQEKDNSAQSRKPSQIKNNERRHAPAEQIVYLNPSLPLVGSEFPRLQERSSDSLPFNEDAPAFSGEQKDISSPTYSKNKLKGHAARLSSRNVRSGAIESKSNSRSCWDGTEPTPVIERKCSLPVKVQIKSFADAARSFSLSS